MMLILSRAFRNNPQYWKKSLPTRSKVLLDLATVTSARAAASLRAREHHVGSVCVVKNLDLAQGCGKGSREGRRRSTAASPRPSGVPWVQATLKRSAV